MFVCLFVALIQLFRITEPVAVAGSTLIGEAVCSKDVRSSPVVFLIEG